MSRGLSGRQRRVLEFMKGKKYIETQQLVDLIYPETKPYRDYFKGRSKWWRITMALKGHEPPGEPIVPNDYKWWSLQRMMLSLERRGLVKRRRPWRFERHPVKWALPEMLTKEEKEWPILYRKSIHSRKKKI